MSQVDLSALYRHILESLATDLRGIRKTINHAPTKGKSIEQRWITLLEKILPQRYSVSGGFVVDSKGAISDQIDIIVYDRQYSALLYDEADALHIPVEAVLAVFEVKPKVDHGNLVYAGNKVASVRKLTRTSARVLQMDGRRVRKKPEPILGGLLAVQNGYTKSSEAFRRSLSKLKKIENLEVVFSSDGFLYPWQTPTKEDSLVSFFCHLNATLQARGNPPALDYLTYLKGMTGTQ